VGTETQKIAMRLDADPRLVAAAGGVVRYFADAAGLASAAVGDLQSATITVCNQEIAQLDGSQRGLEVVVVRSPDRIEVSVSRATSPGAKAGTEDSGTIVGADQVEHETRADRKITRLRKYVNASASGA
jgi:hypothetical protein